MKGNTEKDYRYDAFISYRHLPLDMAVAGKITDTSGNLSASKEPEESKKKENKQDFS